MVSSPISESQPLLEPDVAPSRDLDSVFGEPHFVAKLIATSYNYLVSGIAVTALGALIPSIEAYHGISDGTIAAIFPCVVAGYLCSTISNHQIHARFGRRGLGVLSALARFISLSTLSLGPSFTLCLVAFCILGFGTGLTDSGWSAWGASLRHPNIVQGPLHGSFGVGCIAGPLLAVAFIDHSRAWYQLYRLLSLLVIVEFALQLWAFWYDNVEDHAVEIEQDINESEDVVRSSSPCDQWNIGRDGVHVSHTVPASSATSASNPFLFRGTYLCTLFFFVYVSIEFTYSDWIVVYMRRARDMPYATAGLASSVFWLGMSVGRISLSAVSEYFGVKRCIFTYLTLSAVCQVIFRFATHPTIALVLLGVNGFFLGPTFPSGLVLLSDAVPQNVQISAVAVACAGGQLGAASIPYLIGFMAEKIGIGRLLDVVLSLTVLLLTVWLVFCRLH